MASNTVPVGASSERSLPFRSAALALTVSGPSTRLTPSTVVRFTPLTSKVPFSATVPVVSTTLPAESVTVRFTVSPGATSVVVPDRSMVRLALSTPSTTTVSALSTASSEEPAGALPSTLLPLRSSVPAFTVNGPSTSGVPSSVISEMSSTSKLPSSATVPVVSTTLPAESVTVRFTVSPCATSVVLPDRSIVRLSLSTSSTTIVRALPAASSTVPAGASSSRLLPLRSSVPAFTVSGPSTSAVPSSFTSEMSSISKVPLSATVPVVVTVLPTASVMVTFTISPGATSVVVPDRSIVRLVLSTESTMTDRALSTASSTVPAGASSDRLLPLRSVALAVTFSGPSTRPEILIPSTR